MLGASEHCMQRGSVDNEHAQAGTRNDPGEVVVVANDATSKWERELGFDSKDLKIGL